MASKQWIDFWNTQNDFRDVAWQKNMQIFISKSAPILEYSSEDTVLDIGCGPGFLPTFLKGRVKEVCGLDTSENYIKLCQKKFQNIPGFHFYALNKKKYIDYSCLKDKKFTIIVCQSVIQYFKDIQEVENLILEVKKYAKNGARFLISDIAINRTMLPGIWSHLVEGAKDFHFLIEVLKMFYRARTSDYHKILSTTGILVIPEEEIKAMIQRLRLNATILSDRMTTNGGRRHLLIQFD